MTLVCCYPLNLQHKRNARQPFDSDTIELCYTPNYTPKQDKLRPDNGSKVAADFAITLKMMFFSKICYFKYHTVGTYICTTKR